MCAIVLYTKRVKGRLYPKAARTGPYAFSQEVSRVDGRVVTRYLGIVKVSEKATVVERGEESDADQTREPEQVQQKIQ